MICPDSDLDCDNPGCRHGGCQGRRPSLPLFRDRLASLSNRLPLFEAAGSAATASTGAEIHAERRDGRRELATA